MTDQRKTLYWLMLATLAGMSPWFITAAVLHEMAAEAAVSDTRLAALSSAVPLGFALGAMAFALSGIPDRFDPRRVFSVSAFVAAATTLALNVVPVGGNLAIALRFAAGVAMSGVWPLAMKIGVGWSVTGRGLILGSLGGALVAGKALPYLLAWIAGDNWRGAVVAGAALALIGAGAVLRIGLGPHHAHSQSFKTRAVLVAWSDRRVRAAIFGYLGHMWEFIAFWSWAGVFTAASYAASVPEADAVSLGKLTAFLCIFVAAPATIIGGAMADRIGKDRVAAGALGMSGIVAVLVALTFGMSVWLTFALVILWGSFVVADSPQFSALVADFAPPELAGSILTLQASLGFLLTVFTVQSVPWVVSHLGWPGAVAALALGPVFGLIAMRPAARAARARIKTTAPAP